MYVLKDPCSPNEFISNLQNSETQLIVHTTPILENSLSWETFNLVYHAALNIEIHYAKKYVIYRKEKNELIPIGNTEETERLYVNYKETNINP